MRLKYKLSLILIVSISIASLIGSLTSYMMQRQMIDTVMYEQSKLILHQFRQSLISTQQKTTSISEFVAALPPVKTAFAQRDREQLTRTLLPAYQILYDKHNYSQAQFHEPPSTSFLRLHNLEKYGDDLSSFRETVLEANHDKTSYQGIEAGVSGVSIRSVVPVTHHNLHIGTFELGLELTELLEDLKDSNGIESGIFMDIDLLNQSLNEQSQLNHDPFFGSFKLTNTTKTKLMQELATESRLLKVKDEQFGSRDIRGFKFAVITMPLRDFSNRKIGVVILAKNFSYYHDLANISLMRTISISLIGIILVATFLLILESYFFHNPLAILAKNNDKSALQTLAQRNDEIGHIAQQLLDKQTTVDSSNA